MKNSHLQYQAQALRLEKIIFIMESVLVYVAALFTSILLPSLLMQYVFKNVNPFEAPKAVEYIPVVAFLIATGYFIYAAVTTSVKAMQIKKLEKEMVDLGDCCCDCSDDEELRELEKLAQKAVSAKMSKKLSKNKSGVKTAKKK